MPYKKKFSSNVVSRRSHAQENRAAVQAFAIEQALQRRLENAACVAAFKKDEAAREYENKLRICDERRWEASAHAKLIRDSKKDDKHHYAVHKHSLYLKSLADAKRKKDVKAKHVAWRDKRDAKRRKAKRSKRKFLQIGPRHRNMVFGSGVGSNTIRNAAGVPTYDGQVAIWPQLGKRQAIMQLTQGYESGDDMDV